MISILDLYQKPWWFVLGLLVVVLWTLIWKGLALWFSGKNKQKGWFVVMFLFNTAGLLPIIYLIWFKPREKVENNLRKFVREQKAESAKKKTDQAVKKTVKKKVTKKSSAKSKKK